MSSGGGDLFSLLWICIQIVGLFGKQINWFFKNDFVKSAIFKIAKVVPPLPLTVEHFPVNHL